MNIDSAEALLGSCSTCINLVCSRLAAKNDFLCFSWMVGTFSTLGCDDREEKAVVVGKEISESRFWVLAPFVELFMFLLFHHCCCGWWIKSFMPNGGTG